MSKKLFILSLGISLILFMGDIPQIFAQDFNTEEFTLEEITVTAEKRESDLQKTPISIQTMTGDELTKEAKLRLDEIMQGVVGVASQGSQVGSDFYMRGIGTGNFGPPTAGLDQPAVAVLIDGVYQNRGEVVRGGTLDMARVEIMRGTQSTTLGGSSLAGAVSLVSNNPIFKYEGSGSLELGNYHLMSAQGVLNVPLSDTQALRLAYSTNKRDGYISSGAGDSDLSNARFKYRWQPTETIEIIATFNHQKIGGNGVDMRCLTYDGYWEGYNAANADKYDSTMGYPIILGHLPGVKYDERDNPWDDGYPTDQWTNHPLRHTNINQYSAEIIWDLGIGTMTMTPSFQKAHNQQTEPSGATGYRVEERWQETKQIDLQMASASDSTLEWLGGIYYYDTRLWGTSMTASYETTLGRGMGEYTGNMTYGWINNDPNSQTSYAGYGNLTYPVLDRLRIDAGLRYTRDKKLKRQSTGMDGVAGTLIGPSGPYEYATDESTWKSLTYRVGGEYDVTEDAMVYVLYATGYQPGTFAGGGTTDNQDLEQWTAGLKSRWFDKKLQLNLEGFQSTYHNRPLDGGLSFYTANWLDYNATSQCGTGGPDGVPYTFDDDLDYACYSSGQGVTIPKMNSQGADLSINWIITAADRIDASAEYLHSVQRTPQLPVTKDYFVNTAGMSDELATTVYNGLIAAANDYDGLTLQNSPKWSANASYSHMFTLPIGSTLTPKLNMEYKDSYWSMGGGPGANIADTAWCTQAAYILWNAYLSYNSADGQFTVSAYAKNIQNKPILTNVGGEGAAKTVSLAAPRTFGVVCSARF